MNSKQLNILLGIIIIILLAVIGYIVYNPSQNKSSNLPNSVSEISNNTDSTAQPATNNTSTGIAKDTQNQPEGWNIYTGTAESVKYQISYPKGWAPDADNMDQTVGFFPPRSVGPDMIWSISAEHQKSRTKNTIIRDIEADINKDGFVSTKATITIPSGTATRISVSKPETDINNEYIIVQVGDVIYTMFKGPQMGIKDSFEKFYKSFTVVK